MDERCHDVGIDARSSRCDLPDRFEKRTPVDAEIDGPWTALYAAG